MRKEIFLDEIKTARKATSKYQQYRNKLAVKSFKRVPRKYDRYVIITDGTTVEDIAAPVLCGYASKEVYIVNAFPEFEFHKFVKEEIAEKAKIISVDEMRQTVFTETAFILLIDAKKKHDKWFELLEMCADYTSSGANNYLLVSVLVPPVRKLPASVTALAEREYDFWLEKSDEPKTDEESFLLDLEKECRRIVKSCTDRISLLRFDNLFGSLGTNFAAFDFDKLVKDAFAEKEVMVTKEDRLNYFSCSDSRDAAIAVLAATSNSVPGHEYNVITYSLSVADLKLHLQQLYPDEIALKTDGQTYSKDDIEYHNLSSLKFNNVHIKLKDYYRAFKNSLYYTLCCRFDREFDAVSRLTVYQGKLNRLKETEIEILREIDRICRKYNIKYFLAGGTCLGAIRNGKSIPWDDDLDIGMLREDFEIFRRVAPQELDSGRFIYSSPRTDENCHYYFDKIRLRDTYFSTLYSGKFVMDDGVFVDIVVYDNTTSNKFIQNAQIRLINCAIDAIYIRWHDHPVKRRKNASKYLLPVIRRIPFETYHDFYDKVATIFEKKQDAKYLLDGGMHLKNGGFDKSTLDGDVTLVSYDGMENVPIPSNYPGYLKFLYGENYRPEPSISSRLGAHKIARLDLGKYLVDNNPEQTFRSVDIRGELFEDEAES